MTFGQSFVLGILFMVAVMVALQRYWTRPGIARGATLPDAARSGRLQAFPGSGALFFHSASCGPCRAMMPGLRALADQRDDVWILDVADHLEVVQALGIRATPSLVVLREGRVTETHTGFLPPNVVRAKIEAA